MRGRTIVNGFALALGVLFFVATLFQLADQLNLVHQPPAIPDSANLVDRVTALIPFRHDEWPIFFLGNALICLGFLALVGLGLGLATRVGRGHDRRQLLQWAAVSAGLIGAVAQLVVIGASKAAIDIPYCDCGFKDTEIVSQVWAEMVAGSAAQWLIYAASLLSAAVVVVGARAFGDRVMPSSWTLLSYVTAIALVATVILGFVDAPGDLASWVTALVTGILVPLWALWIWRSFPAGEPATA